MRILNLDKNETLDEVEILLTDIDAENLHLRLYDLAYNPGYKDDNHLDEEIDEEAIKSEDGRFIISKTIYISIITEMNLNLYPEIVVKLINEDKV